MNSPPSKELFSGTQSAAFGNLLLVQEADAEKAAYRAARLVKQIGQSRITAKGRFSLALAGGRTPRAFHGALADPSTGHLDWAKVHILFSDERAVPMNHRDSNFNMARETLLEHVPINSKQVHPIAFEGLSHQEACDRYEERVLAVTQNTGVVDFTMLGMGNDGHTASLFPGADGASKENANRLMVATLAPSSSSIRKRASFSYEMLQRTALLALIVVGEQKSARLKEVLFQKGALPIQHVLHGRKNPSYIFVDHQAGAASLSEAQAVQAS